MSEDSETEVSYQGSSVGCIVMVVAICAMLTFMCYFVSSCATEVNW